VPTSKTAEQKMVGRAHLRRMAVRLSRLTPTELGNGLERFLFESFELPIHPAAEFQKWPQRHQHSAG